MKIMKRREFIKGTAIAGSALLAPAFIKNLKSNSPNQRVNVAVAGISGSRPRIRGMINGKGMKNVRSFAKVPNVQVSAVCDVDERLFSPAVSEIEYLFGVKPRTEVDFRNLLDDKDIDVFSIATPDHWHALQTIWACQAGKDVFVEKPVSYNISEGRKMVEAVKKYNRVVLGGMTNRYSRAINEGIRFINQGKLGNVYMARGLTYRYRPSIGRISNSPIPNGVHWDLFLGPAPYRSFNENRFHYTWHWFWDTGTSELGNTGIYRMDLARWALNKNTHPVKVHCTGGLFGPHRDSDQEVPNMISATYEYDDGMIIQNEIRSLYTNEEGPRGSRCFIFSDAGWMALTGNGFETYFGPGNEPGPRLSDDDIPLEDQINGLKEFIDCVRERRTDGIRSDITEGHLSASLGHLAVISYRTGRALTFNPDTELFVNDKEADSYLSRNYRPPYVMPKEI